VLQSQSAAQPSSRAALATPLVSTNESALLRAEVDKLRIEVERLKGLGPDQAHAMADVGYHFANLWLAAGQENWPLADFYLGETRSHLRWAVRIIPVRKTRAGAEVELQGILDSIDKSPGVMLSAVKSAIDQKNTMAFTNAYRQTLEGCYSCHKASEKPFIRPQIPKRPVEHSITMDPDAKWPQ